MYSLYYIHKPILLIIVLHPPEQKKKSISYSTVSKTLAILVENFEVHGAYQEILIKFGRNFEKHVLV
jgi:hypothetical protein